MEPKASHLWPTRAADAAYIVGLAAKQPQLQSMQSGSQSSSESSDSDSGTAEWHGAMFGEEMWGAIGNQFTFQPGVPCYDTTEPLPIVDIVVVMPSRGDKVPDGYEVIDYTVGGLEADLNRGSPFGYATKLAVKRYSPFDEPALPASADAAAGEAGEGMVPCVPAADVFPAVACPVLDIDIFSGSAAHVAAAVKRDNTGAGSISGLQYPNGVRRSGREEDDYGLSAKGFLHSDFGPSVADLEGAGYLPHSLGNPTCLAPWSLVRHTPAQNDADLNALSGGDTLWLAFRRHASGPALAKPYWGRATQLVQGGSLVAGVAPRAAPDTEYAIDNAHSAGEAATHTADLAALASGRIPQSLAAAAAAALGSAPAPFVSSRAHMRGPIVDIAVVNVTQGESVPPGYVLLHTSVNLGAIGDRIHLAYRRGKPMGLQNQPLAASLISTYPPQQQPTGTSVSSGVDLRAPPRIDVPAGLPAFVETHGCLFGGALADYRLQQTPSAWSASYQGVLQAQQQLAVGETAAWGHSARIRRSASSAVSDATAGSSGTWDGPVLRRRSMVLEATPQGGVSSKLAAHASAESVESGGAAGGGAPVPSPQRPAGDRRRSSVVLGTDPGPSELAVPTCLSHAGLPPPRHTSELQPCELMDEKGRVSFLYSLRFSRRLPSATAQALTLWYALCRCDGSLLLAAARRGIAAWSAEHQDGTPHWLHRAADMKYIRVPEAAFHLGFLSALQLRGILEESLVAMHNVLLCDSPAPPPPGKGGSTAIVPCLSVFKQAHSVQLAKNTGTLFGFGLGYAVPLQAYIHLLTGDFALPLRPVLPLSVCSTFRLQLNLLPDAQPFTFEVPSPLSLPPTSGSFSLLFQCLSPLNIVNVMGLLMLERRVLFHSRHSSALCPVSQALKSLLWPLSWAFQHIPIVPPHMGALLESPVTTLLGMLTDDLPEEIPPEVWVVNLDLDCISRGCSVKSVLPSAEAGGRPKVFLTPNAPQDELLLSDASRSAADVCMLLQSPPASGCEVDWEDAVEELGLKPEYPAESGGVFRWGVPGHIVAGTREVCVVPPRLPVQGHVMEGGDGGGVLRLPVSSTASTPQRPALLQLLRSPGSPYQQYAQGMQEWNTEHGGGLSFSDVAQAVQHSEPPGVSPSAPQGENELTTSPKSENSSQAALVPDTTARRPSVLLPDPAFRSGLPLHAGKASISADAWLLSAGQFIRDIALAAGAADALTLAGMAGGTAAEGDPFPLCSAAGTVRAIGHALALRVPEHPLGTRTYLNIQHQVHASIARLPPGQRSFVLRAVMAAPLVAPLPPLLPPLPNGSMALGEASSVAVSDMQSGFRGGAAARVHMRSALAEALQDTPRRAERTGQEAGDLWGAAKTSMLYQPWFHAGAAMHDLESAPAGGTRVGPDAVADCAQSHLWSWGELPPSSATRNTKTAASHDPEEKVSTATLIEHLMVSVPPQAAVLLSMRFAALGTGRNPLGVDLAEQVAATSPADGSATPQVLRSASAAHDDSSRSLGGRRRSVTQPEDEAAVPGGGGGSVVSAFFGASAEAEARQRSSRKKRANPSGAPSRMSMRASANAGGAEGGQGGLARSPSGDSSDDDEASEGGASFSGSDTCPSGVPGVPLNPYGVAAVTSHGAAIRMGGGPASDANDTILSETRTTRGQAAEKWLAKHTREAAARFLVQAVGGWREHLWLDGEQLLQERRNSVLAGVEQQIGTRSEHSGASSSSDAFPLCPDSDVSSLGSDDDSSEDESGTDDETADSAVAEAVACAVISGSDGLRAAPVAVRAAAHDAAKSAVLGHLRFVPEHIAGLPVLDLAAGGSAGGALPALLRRCAQRHVAGGMVQTGSMGLLDELGFVEGAAVQGAAMAVSHPPPSGDEGDEGGVSGARSPPLTPPENHGAALREGVRWGSFAAELVHSQLFHLFTRGASEAATAWAGTAAAGALGAARAAAAAAAATAWPAVDTRRVAALQAARGEVEHAAKVFSVSRRAYLEQHMLRQAPFHVLCDVVTAPLWCRPGRTGAFDELLGDEGSSHILSSPAVNRQSPVAALRSPLPQAGTLVTRPPVLPKATVFRVPRDSDTPRRLLRVASDRDMQGHQAAGGPPPAPPSESHDFEHHAPKLADAHSPSQSARELVDRTSPSRRLGIARRASEHVAAGDAGGRNFKSLTASAYKPRRASARPAFHAATLHSRMRLRAAGGRAGDDDAAASATDEGSQRHAALVLQRALSARGNAPHAAALKHAKPAEVQATVDSFLAARGTADGESGQADESPLSSLEGGAVDGPFAVRTPDASSEHGLGGDAWGGMPASMGRVSTEWVTARGVYVDGPAGTSALSLAEATQQTLLLCCFGEGDPRVLLEDDEGGTHDSDFKVPHMSSVLRLRKQDHALSSSVVRLAAHVLDVLRRLEAQSKRLARQFAPAATGAAQGADASPLCGAAPLPLRTGNVDTAAASLCFRGTRPSLESLSRFTSATDSVQGAVPFVNLRVNDAADLIVTPLQWEAEQELGVPSESACDVSAGSVHTWTDLAASCRSTHSRLRFAYDAEWDMNLRDGAPPPPALPWRLVQGAATDTAQRRLLRLLSKKGHERAAKEFHALTRPPSTNAASIWPQFALTSPRRPAQRGAGTSDSAEPETAGAAPTDSTRTAVAKQLLKIVRVCWRWLLRSDVATASDAALSVLLATGSALAFRSAPEELLVLLQWLASQASGAELRASAPLVPLAGAAALLALAAAGVSVGATATAPVLSSFPQLQPAECSKSTERVLAQLVLPAHLRALWGGRQPAHNTAPVLSDSLQLTSTADCTTCMVACLAVLLQSTRVQELQQQVASTEAASLQGGGGGAEAGGSASATAALAPTAGRKSNRHRRKRSDAGATRLRISTDTGGGVTPLHRPAQETPRDALAASQAALHSARKATLARSNSSSRQVAFNFGAEEADGGGSEASKPPSQSHHRRHRTASDAPSVLMSMHSSGSVEGGQGGGFARERLASRSARQASSQAKMKAAESLNEWLFSTATGTGVAIPRQPVHSSAGDLWGGASPVSGGAHTPAGRSRRYSEAARASRTLSRSASDGGMDVQGTAPSPVRSRDGAGATQQQEDGGGDTSAGLPPPSPAPHAGRRSLTISTSARSMLPLSPVRPLRPDPLAFSTPGPQERSGVSRGGVVSEATTPAGTATAGGRGRRSSRRSTLDSRPERGPMRSVFMLAARVTSFLQQQGVCASTAAGGVQGGSRAESTPAAAPPSFETMCSIVRDAIAAPSSEAAASQGGGAAVFVLSRGALEALEGGAGGNGALFAGASAEAESRLSPAEGAGHMRSRTSMSPGADAEGGEGGGASGSKVLSLYRLLPEPRPDEAQRGPIASGVTREQVRSGPMARRLLAHLLSLEGPLDCDPGEATSDSFNFVTSSDADVSPAAALGLLWGLAQAQAPVPAAASRRLLLQVSTFVARTAGLQLPHVGVASQVVLLLPRHNASFSLSAAWRAVASKGGSGGVALLE